MLTLSCTHHCTALVCIALQVIDVHPAGAVTGSPTALVVIGHGFMDVAGLACSFGLLSTPATFVNSARIACESPSTFMEPSVLPFGVTVNGVNLTPQVRAVPTAWWAAVL
jgi:IPT/TIG domain